MIRTVRRFYTEGTVEKVITKNSRTADGAHIFERINLISRISQLAPWQKRALGGYGLLAVGSFTFGIYNDGKAELKEHWANSKYHYSSDWDAARTGCSKHVWTRFWESVFFPYTCVSNTMPYLVLATTSKG